MRIEIENGSFEGKEKREEAEVDDQSFKGSHSATAPVSKIVVKCISIYE